MNKLSDSNLRRLKEITADKFIGKKRYIPQYTYIGGDGKIKKGKSAVCIIDEESAEYIASGIRCIADYLLES